MAKTTKVFEGKSTVYALKLTHVNNTYWLTYGGGPYYHWVEDPNEGRIFISKLDAIWFKNDAYNVANILSDTGAILSDVAIKLVKITRTRYRIVKG